MAKRTSWKSSKPALARVFKGPKSNLHPPGSREMEGKAVSASGQESGSQLMTERGSWRTWWQPSIQSLELRLVRAGEVSRAKLMFIHC